MVILVHAINAMIIIKMAILIMPILPLHQIEIIIMIKKRNIQKIKELATPLMTVQ